MTTSDFYIVQPNDTLSSIARRTGVPVSELVKLNGIRNPNRIAVGKKLALSKRAVCGVNVQFLDRDHNPLRNLPYVIRYCGKEASGKTDDNGRAVAIQTDSPVDQVALFVRRAEGDLKEIATIVSGYANKVVTLVSPKLKLEARTRPHPNESQVDRQNRSPKQPVDTQHHPSAGADERNDAGTTEGVLQSAWSWLQGELGIRTHETCDRSDKPVARVTKDVVSLEFLEKYTGETLAEADYTAAAQAFGCEVEVIKAIEMVESGGSGFDKHNRPFILYERHVFSRNTNPKHKYDEDYPGLSAKAPYTYGKLTKIKSVDELSAHQYPNAGGKELNNEFSYQRLMRAYKLDKDAALKACSWGKFQVLGENYSGGFVSVQDMVKAVSKNEAGQFQTFLSFIKMNRLEAALQSKDWLHIARTYNGKRQNGYDLKLKKQYEALVEKRSQKDGV